MKVVITPEAQAELNEIWNWNCEDRGLRHADTYVAFLAKHIKGLAKNYGKGKAVGTRSDLRYIQMKKKARGHGHIALFTILGNEITVVHVFHTAQDWQAKLEEESE